MASKVLDISLSHIYEVADRSLRIRQKKKSRARRLASNQTFDFEKKKLKDTVFVRRNMVNNYPMFPIVSAADP